LYRGANVAASRSAQRAKLSSRDIGAALFALLAFALMLAAALDFRPANRQQLLDSATLKMIAGALALGAAVRLSLRLPPLPKPLDVPLAKMRRFWWLFAVLGVVLIGVVAQVNADILRSTITSSEQMPASVQYALWMAGIALVAYGFGGAPSLKPRRFRVEWSIVLPLGAILLLALFLRLWEQGVTQRYLVDELHFSDALLTLERRPSLPILSTLSGESPFTWIYTIWQTVGIRLFGHTFFGFRVTAAVIGTLTVLAAYALAREVFDRKTALLAALALATFPPHVHFSRTAIIQIADPLFGALALLFVARALRRNYPLEWALAGVALGMTQYFYEGARLLFPPLVVGYVILVALRGGMRGKWRGFAMMLVVALVVGAPVYYALLAAGKTLFGRFGVSGLGAPDWRQFGAEGVLPFLQHLLTPFQIFVTQPDLAAYYGGQQALVLETLVPFFLFGCFYLTWRYPAKAFVIPLWVAAVGLGNGLLRDTLVSSRYLEVLPALAIALAAGVRYLLAFFLDERRALRLAVLVVVVIAVAQVGYYFGTHLEQFKVQVRDEKGYRDGIDAALRALDLPGNTQVYLVGKPRHDQTVPRNWLDFLSRDGDAMRYYPLLSVQPEVISPKFLIDLPSGVNYAFFVEPTETTVIAQIYRYFPNVTPPQYSTSDIPADKEYLLFFVSADTAPNHVR
jgi:hypothetical protein